MEYFKVPRQTVLVEADRPGLYFFVVNSGFCNVKIPEGGVNMVGPGEAFGELALMHDSPRVATISTTRDTELWALSRPAFRKIAQQI